MLPTHEFIRPYLKAGGIAVDVGAHIGTHTVCMMRALGPQGKVYSFEPHPEIYPALEYNIAKEIRDNPQAARAVALKLAAGSKRALIELYCNPTNYASNTTLDNVFDCKLPLEVEMIALDQIIPEEEEICLIKIDVEGGEYRVLQGTEKLLQRWHPVIFMEFSENFLPLAGITEEEFYAWLRDRGYSGFVPFPQDWIRAGHHAHDLLVLP
jgi:FkbM family methyltransferase